MTLYEQERIEDMKADKYAEQCGMCAACGEPLKLSEPMELSHIIPQRKYLIKLYGKEIIHHELNMKLCHAGACNNSCQMSPNKTILVEKHVNMIMEAIENEKEMYS